MPGYSAALAAGALLLSLGACAHTEPEREERQAQGSLPSYVVLMGAGAWFVQCPGQTVTVTDIRDSQVFYKADGTQKTRNEFCADYNSGSRVRRGQ